MPHRRSPRKFGRVRKVRQALMRSLLRALVMKEKIRTTEAKAKELRAPAERMITHGKKNTLSARRLVISRLDEASARKVFSVLAPRYEKRSGGYVRIIKLPPRASDGAKMALIEFVR